MPEFEPQRFSTDQSQENTLLVPSEKPYSEQLPLEERLKRFQGEMRSATADLLGNLGEVTFVNAGDFVATKGDPYENETVRSQLEGVMKLFGISRDMSDAQKAARIGNFLG